MNRGKKILALLKNTEQSASSQCLPELEVSTVSLPGYSLQDLPIEFDDGFIFEGDSINTSILCDNAPNNLTSDSIGLNSINEEEINKGVKLLNSEVEKTHNRMEDSIEDMNLRCDNREEATSNTDPDYVLSNSEETDESESELLNEGNFDDNHNENSDPQHSELANKRSKKIDLDKNKWKRNENKRKRMKGEEYLGFTRRNKKWKHNKIRQERKIKERCDGKHCERTKVYFCNKVTDDKRDQIFRNFWKDLTWDQKKMFVVNNVRKAEPRRRRSENKETEKSNSFIYYLRVAGQPLRVCKKMFLNTICIGEWSVRNWCNTEVNGMIASSAEVNNKRRISQEPKLCEKRKFLENWFDKVPKMPSHYARADTKKEYIEDNLVRNKSQLYKRYVESCEGKPLSTFVFDEIFERKNLGIFQPRKDQCDDCCRFKTGNMNQEEYEAHITSKDRARIEKQTDKAEAIKENCHLITMDLQAVQLCPRMYASTLYYKQKLRVHNFTMYNLATHQSTNFWWHECEGKLEASNFVSCIIDYLQTQFNQSSLPIIIYSDGCGYQNRNSILSNALLTFSVINKKIIEQKFLVKGHTQMECDSVHSLIERSLDKREIYLPGEYVSITKHARKNPFPLDAKYLHHDFFKNYTEPLFQWYSSIRPPGAIVFEIRALKYTPEGVIYYKTDFDSDYVPLRRTKSIAGIENVNYKKLYSSKLKISFEKYEQLLAITKVMDSDYHDFYKNLPHEVSKKN